MKDVNASNAGTSNLSKGETRAQMKSPVGMIFGATCGAALAIGFGYLVGKGGAGLGRLLTDLPGSVLFAIIVIELWLVIALHELGHLLAGLKLGFQFRMYTVGPLCIQRKSGKHLEVNLNRDLRTFGGFCAMVPQGGDSSLVRKFTWFVLGGPMMSLAVAISCLASGFLMTALPGPFRFAVIFLGVLSAGIFLVTAIPMKNGAFMSDGARFLRLRDGGPLGKREAAILSLFAAGSGGMSAADYPDEWLRDALEIIDGSIFEATALSYSSAKHLEMGEVALAREENLRAYEIARTVGGSVSVHWVAAHAWFLAWIDAEGEKALELLAEIEKSKAYLSGGTLEMVQAAIAYALGDFQNAKTLLERALRFTADSQEDRTWIRRMANEVEKQLA